MGLQIKGRAKRKIRVRGKVSGDSDRPRMSVFRSLKHIYAQVVNDVDGKTIAHASTLSKDVKGPAGEATKKEAAKLVGKAIAAQLKAKGVTKVVFDRNGYMYHGRIQALAEGAREAGLEF